MPNKKMARIFTYRFEELSIEALAADQGGELLQVFQAEEDVVIVGYELFPFICAWKGLIGNDGWGHLSCNLQQGAQEVGAAAFSMAAVWCVWNTSPAAVAYGVHPVQGMFPEGMGIPLKEEGKLNVKYTWRNTSAADLGFNICVTVYYIRAKTIEG